MASNVHFYEFLARVLVVPESKTSAINRHLGESKLFDGISDILGQKVINYGIHIAPPNESPSGPEWIDIQIKPNVHAAESRLLADVVYRSADRSKVFGFCADCEKSLTEIFDLIEG